MRRDYHVCIRNLVYFSLYVEQNTFTHALKLFNVVIVLLACLSLTYPWYLFH